MAATAFEFGVLLEPTISNIWHDAFPAHESKYAKVLNVRDMKKSTITDAKLAGFGPMAAQPDGDSVTYDDPIAPVTKQYTYSNRALAYRVHERIWRFDLYGEVARFEQDLLDSAKDDAETAGWGLFNNGFTTTNTGFDGLGLFSASHTRMDGGAVQGNRASTDEALSVAGLQNALITIGKWKNDRGRPRVHKAKTLVIPVDLQMVAYEILDSVLKPGGANNDKNVLASRFDLQPLVVEYVTSTTAWFLVCDKHDLNFFWAIRPETGMKTRWDTESIDRKVRQGYVTGFGEWRGVFGSDGVA